MSREKTPPHFYDAISALCEGTATAEQAAALEASLRESKELRKAYLAYLEIHAELDWPLEAHGDESATAPRLRNARAAEVFREQLDRETFAAAQQSPQPTGVLPVWGSWQNRPGVFAVAFSLAFIFAGLTVLGLVRLEPRSSASPAATSAEQSAQGVLLVGAWECEREGGAMQAQLNRGESLELRRGLVQLRFACGAEILLEGPAKFHATSSLGGRLDQGRLTAVVPPRGRGFAITTPHLQVVDFGTEFGVEVDSKGTEVHVFSGEVEAQWRAADGAPFRQLLAQSQALRFNDAQRTIEMLTAAPAQFICSVADFVAGKRGGTRDYATASTSYELAISPEYVAAVQRSTPLAYWRFESLEEDFTLRDEMGRFPLKAVGLAEIRGTTSNRLLSLPLGASLISEQPLTGLERREYSVEMWFQAMNSESSCLMSIQTESTPNVWRGTVFLGTWRELQENRLPRTVRGMHRWPPSSNPQRGANLYHRVSADGWQHVVLVKTAAELQLYSQGVKVLATRDASLLGGKRHRVTVGRFHDAETARWYQGAMDELAIYSRALNAAEIAEHFSHVKVPGGSPK